MYWTMQSVSICILNHEGKPNTESLAVGFAILFLTCYKFGVSSASMRHLLLRFFNPLENWDRKGGKLLPSR